DQAGGEVRRDQLDSFTVLLDQEATHEDFGLLRQAERRGDPSRDRYTPDLDQPPRTLRPIALQRLTPPPVLLLDDFRSTADDRAVPLPGLEPAVPLQQLQRPDDGRAGHPEGLHQLVLTRHAGAGRVRAVLDAPLKRLREAHVL